MPNLNASQQKVLKLLHLIAVSCWLGGAIGMNTLRWLRNGPLMTTDGQLAGVNQALHHIDIWVVVIPGAIGCLLTGLVYCIFTRWGFFRHPWVTIKLVLTIVACLFGTFFLGPWVEAMGELSLRLGLSALNDPAYLSAEAKNMIGGLGNIAAMVIMFILSIWKPKLWKKSASATR